MTQLETFAAQFSGAVRDYANTAEHNDAVHAAFTSETRSDKLLAEHRAFIERNRLGFGDPAFHAMWRGLLAAAVTRFGSADILEIGVYKGQVISLWALLSHAFAWPVRIHAVSPLEGQPMPPGRFLRRILFHLSPRFRERARNSDFYPDDDYERCIRGLFEHFGLDFGRIDLVRGYSNDPAVLGALAGSKFHIIYIDGDHTYEGVSRDIANFGPKVVSGGWLVMDDAGCDLPGSTFWKGHEAVSVACRKLSDRGFANVLNVGHNRIYEKTT